MTAPVDDEHEVDVYYDEPYPWVAVCSNPDCDWTEDAPRSQENALRALAAHHERHPDDDIAIENFTGELDGDDADR